MFEQDYILRQIQMMTHALARALFRKDSVDYVLPEETRYTVTDHLALDINDLLAQGLINQAEDRLFAALDVNDTRGLELALSFYARLNSFDDDYLYAHDFSREEIEQGLRDVMSRYDVSI